MKIDEIKKEIKKLIAEIIELDVNEIDDDANFVSDLNVDSLRALEVLASLEKKYGIEITEDKLTELTTVNKTIDVTLGILKEKNKI